MPQVLSAQDWFLAVDSRNHAGIREGLRRFAGIRDELGDTALMHAARSGDLAAVKILVDHENSLLNSVQQTALIQAILQEQVNVVRFLRPYESHINTSDNRTPFMVAASAGCSQSLAVLTHYFDLSTNPSGLTALDYAVLGNNLGCTKIIIETQDVTLDHVDYALQLAENQHNRELCLYLSSVRHYIKQKLQGRGVSGRKQLFCIPANELQEMGTVLDKVVRTRVESAKRPSSAKASLSVHIPRSKALDSSSGPPQPTLSAPQAARITPGIRFPVPVSSLNHGKQGSTAKFVPGVIPSSAVNSFLQTQAQAQLAGNSISTSLLSSSSGGRKSSRPSSARAASRPGSAQKSHSTHKKVKESRDGASRHKHDRSRSRDHRESDAMILITSLNKELSVKTYENLKLEKENEDLKKTIAILRTNNHSSEDITAQLDVLKRQIERKNHIIVELETSNKSLMMQQKKEEPLVTDHPMISRDELKQQYLAIHKKIVEISKALMSRDPDPSRLYSSASGLTIDNLVTDSLVNASKGGTAILTDSLLTMSSALLQALGVKSNEGMPSNNALLDTYTTEGSLAISNAPAQNSSRNQHASSLEAENHELKTRCIGLLESLTAAQSEVARLSSLQADNDATQISELVDMKNSQIGELKKRNEALESTTVEIQNLYNELKERYMHEIAEHNTLKKLHEVTEKELEETRKALSGKNTTINSLIKRMATLRSQADTNGVFASSQDYGFSGLTDQSMDPIVFYDASLGTDTLSTENNHPHQPISYTDAAMNYQSKMEHDAPAVYLRDENTSVGKMAHSHEPSGHQSSTRSDDNHQSFITSPPLVATKHYPSVTEEMTPLMKAIIEGNARGVGSSLKYLQETLPDGTTALMLAVQHGRQSFIKYLLEKEARMRRSDGVTALQLAIESGNLLAIAALEDYEAPSLPDVPTDNGRYTELMQAIEEGCLLDAWSLSRVQAGLSDTSGRTALMLAAQRGCVPAVRFLLNSEAQLRDHNGLSALDYAHKCHNQTARAECIAILQKSVQS